MWIFRELVLGIIKHRIPHPEHWCEKTCVILRISTRSHTFNTRLTSPWGQSPKDWGQDDHRSVPSMNLSNKTEKPAWPKRQTDNFLPRFQCKSNSINYCNDSSLLPWERSQHMQTNPHTGGEGQKLQDTSWDFVSKPKVTAYPGRVKQL